MWRHPSDELASLLSRPESLSTASRPRGLGASADDGDCPHNASMSESADLTSPAEATSAASSRPSLSARIAAGPAVPATSSSPRMLTPSRGRGIWHLAIQDIAASWDH